MYSRKFSSVNASKCSKRCEDLYKNILKPFILQDYRAKSACQRYKGNHSRKMFYDNVNQSNNNILNLPDYSYFPRSKSVPNISETKEQDIISVNNLLWVSPNTERGSGFFSRNSKYKTSYDNFKTPTKQSILRLNKYDDELSKEKKSKKTYIRNELQNKFKNVYEKLPNNRKSQRNAKISKSYGDNRKSSQQNNEKNTDDVYGKIINQALQIYQLNEADKRQYMEKQSLNSKICKNIQQKLRKGMQYKEENKTNYYSKRNYNISKSELKNRTEAKYHIKLYEEKKFTELNSSCLKTSKKKRLEKGIPKIIANRLAELKALKNMEKPEISNLETDSSFQTLSTPGKQAHGNHCLYLPREKRFI